MFLLVKNDIGRTRTYARERRGFQVLLLNHSDTMPAEKKSKFTTMMSEWLDAVMRTVIANAFSGYTYLLRCYPDLSRALRTFKTILSKASKLSATVLSMPSSRPDWR